VRRRVHPGVRLGGSLAGRGGCRQGGVENTAVHTELNDDESS
jgi:hypothetical protein